jgi:hypothetical protein
MGSRKGTVKRVSLTATALTAGLAGAAVVAVATGMVSIGTWVPGNDEPATQLAGSRSKAGDGYGDRGDLFVATQDNRLYRFDKLGTGKQELSVAIIGLAGGERLVGIDTRPANGQLYAVGSTSRLYVIDPISGAASPVGTPFATALSGKRFGVDFNPTVDRLRIVSDTGQNLRVDPTTGTVVGVDTALNRKGVTAAGYTNSVAGATATALYDIDSKKDSLVLQGTRPGVTPVVSPNTGQLFPVGSASTSLAWTGSISWALPRPRCSTSRTTPRWPRSGSRAATAPGWSGSTCAAARRPRRRSCTWASSVSPPPPALRPPSTPPRPRTTW